MNRLIYICEKCGKKNSGEMINDEDAVVGKKFNNDCFHCNYDGSHEIIKVAILSESTLKQMSESGKNPRLYLREICGYWNREGSN